MGKHPYDRKVFFVQQRNEFLSVREIQHLIRTDELSLFELVFDTDGDSYTAESIALGKAPRWAMTAEHDPMLYNLPPLSEEDIAMVNELVCEDDFIEMPKEPQAKTVEGYLASEPRIARMVADAERWMCITGGI